MELTQTRYEIEKGVATVTLYRPDKLDKRPPKFTMKVSSDMPDFYPWWKEPKV